MILLKLERIYTKPFDMNGCRIFVDHLWCRGISKKDAKLDRWAKEIAPSNELRKWFKHVDAKYPKFKTMYFDELNHNPATGKFIQFVKSYLQKGNVILLYGAKNSAHNNAVVLRDYLDQKLDLNQPADHNFVDFLYNDGMTNRSKQLTVDVDYLRKHSAIVKKLKLRTNGNDKIYQNSNKRALDHQTLMQMAKK